MAIPAGPLSPEQQLEVLSLIWGGDNTEEGWVVLPSIPGWCKTKEERRSNWKEGRAFEWPREKAAILEQLRNHKQNELYFSVNKFLEPSRLAEKVGESTTLFADLDEVDPRTIDRAIRPTIAWESSPGRFQAVWLMRGMYFGACEMGGLNHRLTSLLEADPSGYDVTQVLRVPGRLNYKPEYKEENDGDPVQGRLLWVRSQTFDWAEMEERLPLVPGYDKAGEVIEDHEIDAVNRHKVWERVYRKVSPNVRQYMKMKSRQIDPEQHDRSSILWQIERDLADAGCTLAEIVAIVRQTPWNKYEGRANELWQLKNEVRKAKNESLLDEEEDTLTVDEVPTPNQPIWVTEFLREPIKRPTWLVHDIWAESSVGFIAGAPKSYKSYIALDMAISVATGKPFLNNTKFPAGPGRVLYLQEEDGHSLVKHRIEQMLDLKAPEWSPRGQLHMSPVNDAQKRSGTKLECFYALPIAPMPLALHVRTGFIVSNMEWQLWLDEFITEHQFDLVVIDTLGATVGDVDTDKAGPLNERVLKPLKTIAEANRCAIAVVHHNRKPNDNSKTRSGQQMLGSVALHAWVENALYVQGKEPVGDQPLYEVRVERENKLTEDMKFRIRVPQMWTEKRDPENPGERLWGQRQLWEPEILLGWVDQEAEAEKKAIKDAAQVDKLTEAQQDIFDKLVAEGGGLSLDIDHIAVITGKAKGHLRHSLAELVRKDYLSRDGDSWKVNA